MSNDNLNKYSLRLNIDQEIFSWAKMGFTSNLTYQDRNQGVRNTFTKGLSSFPLGDAYDQNGKINHEYITGQYSPLGDFIEDQYVNNTRSTYLNVSGYLELSPIKILLLQAVLMVRSVILVKDNIGEINVMLIDLVMQVHLMLLLLIRTHGIIHGRIFFLIILLLQKIII